METLFSWLLLIIIALFAIRFFIKRPAISLLLFIIFIWVYNECSSEEKFVENSEIQDISTDQNNYLVSPQVYYIEPEQDYDSSSSEDSYSEEIDYSDYDESNENLLETETYYSEPNYETEDIETVYIESECVRIGAICNDGTTSTATGRGACSHHGGVSSWICE